MWKTNPRCSTPSLSGEESNRTKTLAGTFLLRQFHPVHPEGKRCEPWWCLGSEEDPSCCGSTGPAGRRHPRAGICFVPCSPTPPPLPKMRFFSPTARASSSWFNINFGRLPPDPELPYSGISMATRRSSPIWGDRVSFL